MRIRGLLVVGSAGIGLALLGARLDLRSVRAQSLPAEARPKLVLSIATHTLGGNERLNWSAGFTNEGGLPAVVLQPVDGADEGIRCVKYRWELKRVDQEAVQLNRRLWGRCFGVAPLVATDFTRLAPGQSERLDNVRLVPPDFLWDLSRLGTYQLRLVYEYRRPNFNAPPSRYLGPVPRDPTVRRLLDEADEIRVASNWVEFTRR